MDGRGFASVVFFLISTIFNSVETLECISCIAYQINGKDMQTKDNLDKHFESWYDPACAGNPTEASRTVTCGAESSCIQSSFTTRIASQDQVNTGGNGESTEVHFFLRTCSPVKSVESGCKQLSAYALPSVLQFLDISFMIGQGGTTDTGRVCYCNSDRCNRDTTALGALERGKLRLCHNCIWMKFSSDDDSLERDLQTRFGSENTSRHGENCREVVPATATAMCNGDCESAEARMLLTTNPQHYGSTKEVGLYFVHRYCSGVFTAKSSYCRDLKGSHPATRQLLPIQTMEDAGLIFNEAVTSVCTCDGSSCNDDVRIEVTSGHGITSFHSLTVILMTVFVCILSVML